MSCFLPRTFVWLVLTSVADVLVSCFAVRPFTGTRVPFPAEDSSQLSPPFFGDGRSRGISSREILVGCGPSVRGGKGGIFLSQQGFDALGGSHRDLPGRDDRSFPPPGRRKPRSPVPLLSRLAESYGYPDGLASPGVRGLGWFWLSPVSKSRRIWGYGRAGQRQVEPHPDVFLHESSHVIR